MDRPTQEYIKALITWASGSMTLPIATGTGVSPNTTSAGSGYWGLFVTRVERERTYHRLEFGDEVLTDGTIKQFPDNWHVLLPSTGRAKVNAANNMVFVADAQVDIEIPLGHKEGSKPRKEIEGTLTNFGQALIQRDERQGDSSPIVYSKENCMAYGLGAIQTVWKRDAYPKEPTRRKGEPLKGHKDEDGNYHDGFEDRKHEYDIICQQTDPYETKSLAPGQVFYDRTHNPPKWAFTKESRTPWDAAADYPYWAQNSGAAFSNVIPSANNTMVTLVWFWTDKYCACYINGSPAIGPGGSKDNQYKADDNGVAKNPYGFIPIDFAPGGHGDQDPDNRPEYELVGLYKGLLDLLLAEASCFNLEEIMRQRESYGGKKVVYAESTQMESIAKQMVGGPNTVVKIYLDAMMPGTRVEQLPYSQLSPVLSDQQNRLKQMIDTASVPDLVMGAGGVTEAARRSALRIAQSDKQVVQAAVNLEQMYEGNIYKRIMMIKHTGKKPVGINIAKKGMPAEYVTLGPDDIPDNFSPANVKVTLIGDTDEQKQQREALGLERLKAGTLDLDTFLRDYAQEKNVKKIMQGLLNDAAWQAVIIPMYIQALQGEMPKLIAEVAAENGIIMTPEEMQAQLQASQPAQIDPNTGQPIQPQAQAGGVQQVPDHTHQPAQPQPVATNGAHPPIQGV